jgi:hypothetical protein
MINKEKEVEVNYEKVKGSHILKEDAETIGEIFNRIEVEENGVVPHDVITAATDPGSVLHKYFTWDDKAAAHKQRLTEAGYIIRSMNMRVVYAEIIKSDGETSKPREVTVRMLQSTRNDDNDGYVYRSTFKVLGSPEQTTQCYYSMYTYLMGAFRRFHAFNNLTEDLIELEPVIINLAKKLGKTKKEATDHIARIKRGV